MALNSSGLGNNYNPNQAADTVQDVEQFIYRVAEGAAPTLLVAPVEKADAIQIDNCSPCPILATITLESNDKGNPVTSTRKVYLKPNQTRVYDWSDGVVVNVTIDEADGTSAPQGAATPADSMTITTAATADLDVIIDFFNA